MRPINLYPHEIRRALTGETVAIVRPIKKMPCECNELEEMCNTTPEGWQTNGHSGKWWCPCCADGDAAIHSPLDKPGEVRRVKETHRIEQIHKGWRVIYKDGETRDIHMGYIQWHGIADSLRKYKGGWRSPVLMPQWAPRLALDVLTSGAKPVQDVTEDEAEMTGVERWPIQPGNSTEYIRGFADLHDTLFPKRPYAENPTCWIATMRRM